VLALTLVAWAGEAGLDLTNPVSVASPRDGKWSMVRETEGDEEDPIGTAEAPTELHPATWPGFALIGLGVTTTAIGAARAVDAYNRGSQATQWDDYLVAANDYENFVWATHAGLGITAVGTAVAGTGLVITVKKKRR